MKGDATPRAHPAPTWRSGMRLVTLRLLTGADKREYAAGATGFIWDILDDDALVVCMDDASCTQRLVVAHARDVVPTAMLGVGTVVRCMGLVVEVGASGALRSIPRGTEAVVEGYDAQRNVYRVSVPAQNLRFEVPTRKAQPVAPVAAQPRGGGSPLCGTTRSLEGSGGSFDSLDSEPPADPIANLRKCPTYSNLSGSLRSAGSFGSRPKGVSSPSRRVVFAGDASSAFDGKAPTPASRARSAPTSPVSPLSEGPVGKALSALFGPVPTDRQPKKPCSGSGAHTPRTALDRHDHHRGTDGRHAQPHTKAAARGAPPQVLMASAGAQQVAVVRSTAAAPAPAAAHHRPPPSAQLSSADMTRTAMEASADPRVGAASIYRSHHAAPTRLSAPRSPTHHRAPDARAVPQSSQALPPPRLPTIPVPLSFEFKFAAPPVSAVPGA